MKEVSRHILHLRKVFLKTFEQLQYECVNFFLDLYLQAIIHLLGRQKCQKQYKQCSPGLSSFREKLRLSGAFSIFNFKHVFLVSWGWRRNQSSKMKHLLYWDNWWWLAGTEKLAVTKRPEALRWKLLKLSPQVSTQKLRSKGGNDCAQCWQSNLVMCKSLPQVLLWTHEWGHGKQLRLSTVRGQKRPLIKKGAASTAVEAPGLKASQREVEVWQMQQGHSPQREPRKGYS